MDNPLVTSLIVSGIGMLVLFLALAFLCGLMYLLTAVVKDRPEAKEQEAGSRRQEASIGKHRAAAIAVALARTEQELIALPSVPPHWGAPAGGEERGGGVASPWRTLHRNRQLTLNLRTRRVR